MDEFTELFEKSKDDHESKTIVGSEVRYIINAVRAERARIAELETALAQREAVIRDYAEQIREFRAREKAVEAAHGQPMAWAVFLPKGDEYDYAVFPRVEDAKQHAELLDADEEEGTDPRGVMPLYADPTKALDAEREAVRVLGEEVDAAWKWDEAFPWSRPDTWPDATAEAVRANPIAAAAVKGGGG